MSIVFNPETRVFILEGIAGAGKNTLQAELKEHFAGKTIWDFAEEELLFNWKHMWLTDLEEERIKLYHKVLDHVETVLSKDSESVFIFNRFQISWKVFATTTNGVVLSAYDRLVERLRSLPVVTLIPLLDESLIESRSIHKERLDPIWQMYLERKLKIFNCSNLIELYSKEQLRILEIAREQRIPFQTLTVEMKLS